MSESLAQQLEYQYGQVVFIGEWAAVPHHMPYLLMVKTNSMTADEVAALIDTPDWVRTGATERLPDVCPYCGDVYPPGANYCIECRAAR